MSYKDDPRQMTAKFTSTCHKCNKPIKQGENIIYWPRLKKAGHLNCDEADFNAALASFEDEDNYNNQYR